MSCKQPQEHAISTSKADLGFFKGGYCIKKITRRVKARLTSGGFRGRYIYIYIIFLIVGYL